jgi:hypothetical protein
MHRFALFIAVALCACASTPPAAGPEPAAARTTALEPVGTYDFSTSANGSPVNGTIVVTRGTSGLKGTLTSDASGDVPISSVTVEGQRMTLLGQDDMSVILVFNGTDFTGSWSYSGMTGELTGKRRAQ